MTQDIRRFAARTSRDALSLVRQALGADAVVLATQPCTEGVEVMAMTSQAVPQTQRGVAAQAPAPKRDARLAAPEPSRGVDDDVARLTMSTLSFQDYVRERMLRRRQAALEGGEAEAPGAPMPAAASSQPRRGAPAQNEAQATRCAPAPAAAAGRDELLAELRAMRGLIEDRFGALAFIDRLKRHPAQARLTQRLLDSGFSPALIRKLCDGLPPDASDEAAWAAGVLESNLPIGDADPALGDPGGVYALVGSTGVGKTTSTAKMAAAFATRHGASQLGLITLDAYRVAAHEQLRTYGRILGVPVHTAHDRSSLEDLLDLLSGKRLVLIDTAGMAQRDERTRELLDMLGHRSIKRLLVIDAAAQGETIDDVMLAYRSASCEGAVLSKIDEAVKLGPALDALIRHKLRLVGVADGQRVPEDWHRPQAHALVQRALRAATGSAWRHKAGEVSLVFAGAPVAAPIDAAQHAL